MCQHGERKIIAKQTKFTNGIISFWLKSTSVCRACVCACMCVCRGVSREGREERGNSGKKQSHGVGHD